MYTNTSCLLNILKLVIYINKIREKKKCRKKWVGQMENYLFSLHLGRAQISVWKNTKNI